MPRLDPATQNIAIGRFQAGESQNEVARTLNVNQSTISNVMAEYVYIGAGMNVSLPPVFRKWRASVEVVS